VSETQRKALYAAAAAILAALGAFGIVDSAQTEQVLGIVSGALTLAMAVVPVIAHRKVGLAGIAGGSVDAAPPDEADDSVDGIDLSDPDALAATEPRHAEVIPDGEGVATN
jgi:hypothetical protein